MIQSHTKVCFSHQLELLEHTLSNHHDCCTNFPTEPYNKYRYLRPHRFPLRSISSQSHRAITFVQCSSVLVLPIRQLLFHTDLKHTRTLESYRQWIADTRRRGRPLNQPNPAKMFFSPLLRIIERDQLQSPLDICDFAEWLCRES